MANNKLRTLRKSNGGKYGVHYANVRDLNRIINYLDDNGMALKKDIIINCFSIDGAISPRRFKSALLWLKSRNIVLEEKEKSKCNLYYILNEKFKELKTQTKSQEVKS